MRWGWGWVEVKVEVELRLGWGWGWDEVEPKLSWNWVEVVLSLGWDKLTLNKGKNWAFIGLGLSVRANWGSWAHYLNIRVLCLNLQASLLVNSSTMLRYSSMNKTRKKK